MKCLITGMTAAQTNPYYHERSPNFVGLLEDALSEHHRVVWSEPSVDWDLEFLRQFDRVIVGVAPLTGLGANRAYGALSIIERLWDKPSLHLVVDAPDPSKIMPATRSIAATPENLTKEFFSFRKEYGKVAVDLSLQRRLLRAVQHLSDDPWPVTIVPQLPWQTRGQFERQLPKVNRVRLLNLDRLLFDRHWNADTPIRIRKDQWSYEPGTHATWLRRQHVTWEVKKLPRTHRKPIVQETLDMLAESEGCLIAPSKNGTWWSPRYAMALAMGTAVFTDWHESQFLSSAWSGIPASFEEMNPQAQNDLVAEQVASYRAALPKEDEWTHG